ncbi:MAG: LamB/YcsF family protein [Desulfurococcales archaeon]|nr:LamB/YcsF family protein [Desulfurococcales archaeon]
MVRHVDINVDSGESFGRYVLGTDEIFNYVTSANIACGFHAGDPSVMRRTVKSAKLRGVEVGAHPGFPDLMGFGRRGMEVSKEDLINYILYQVGALEGVARAEGVSLQHVKLHGALYNMAWVRKDYAEALAEAVRLINPSLIVVAPPYSEMERATREAGLKVAKEFFLDRNYLPDGRLVPRSESNALIRNVSEAVERALKAVSEGVVKAVNGEQLNVEVDTICVHGDTPEAVEMARALKDRLIEAGIKVSPMKVFI